MVLVLKAHRELDYQYHHQAEAAGIEVDSLTVADIAYPLVTRRLMSVFQQQPVHVCNGCISDNPNHLPFVKVGTINYHSTGHHLDHYQSLLMSVFWQQPVHVCNGCISDNPNHLPFMKVGTINYHSTGHHVDHYQSLRGTSKVEAIHSVLDRTFYSQRGVGADVFDARLGWWMLAYNRHRLHVLGKKVPPDTMPPKVHTIVLFLSLS